MNMGPAVVGLVHPWMGLVAAALGGIPLLIHLLSRRRYQRVRWAAMSFLLAANRAAARRLRLEQLVLLVARCAAIALLGLAFARPYVGAEGLAGLIGEGPSLRVLVVDDSLSAQQQAGGGPTPFEHIKGLAGGLLEGFGSADAVSIVSLARPVRAIFAEPSRDHATCRRELVGLQASAAGGDLAGVLEAAGRIVARSALPPQNRHVYLLLDGARGGLDGPAGAMARLGAAARDVTKYANLYLITAGAAGGENVGTTDLRPSGGLVTVGWPIGFAATVSNFGQQASAPARLVVLQDGQPIRQLALGRIEPGGREIATFSAEFSEPGPHWLEAHLVPGGADALAADNVRYVGLEVRPELAALVVAEPGGRDGAQYVAAALSPRLGPQDRTPIAVRTVSPAELANEPLGKYDIVVLCDVSRLDPHGWGLLRDFVQVGGGLMVFLGPGVQAEAYNAGEAEGVLPVHLEAVVGADGVTEETAVRISGRLLTHPAVAEFAGQPGSGLFLARVWRYWRCRPVPGRAEVILEYEGGDPAVVAGRTGEGRVVVVTTSADMRWTNLPAKGDFVSLVLGLADSVLAERAGGRNVPAGQELVEPLRPDELNLPMRLELPDGRSAAVRVEDGVAHGEASRQAGVHWLSVGGRRSIFGVNPDVSESDLQQVSPEQWRDMLGGAFAWIEPGEEVARVARAGPVREVSGLLLLIVLAVLGLETVLAVESGRRRAAA